MSSQTQPIIIVTGGQYGSEAKGAIAGIICEREQVDIAVRTGATNAGHTVYYKGEPAKMQQLPVGWVNPKTDLILGAGALIDPAILAVECAAVSRLTGVNVRERLWVDARAGVHRAVHAERSKLSGRHYAIGATGKGSSEAIIDKIKGRGSGYQNFGRCPESEDYQVIDTAYALNDKFDEGAKILLEGTQGTLLDLHLGPYPYTTHKQTVPAVWLAEAGLSPNLPLDIVMVVRTFPIRVAGNSGPLPQEISWPELAREINDKRQAAGMEKLVGEWAIEEFEEAVRCVTRNVPAMVPAYSDGLDQHRWKERGKYQEALSELNKYALDKLADERPDAFKEISKVFEFTTVTKKLRRVGRLDLHMLQRASMLVRPTRAALTFMNYLFPEKWGRGEMHTVYNQYSNGQAPFTDDEQHLMTLLEGQVGAHISMVSYGPESKHVMSR